MVVLISPPPSGMESDTYFGVKFPSEIVTAPDGRRGFRLGKLEVDIQSLTVKQRRALAAADAVFVRKADGARLAIREAEVAIWGQRDALSEIASSDSLEIIEDGFIPDSEEDSEEDSEK